MKKSSKRPSSARDNENDVERRRKLQFKKKKQRNQEPKINLKNVRSMQDLGEYGDEYYI